MRWLSRLFGAGTPQGGVISPLLANIFLREVLDTWFTRAFGSPSTLGGWVWTGRGVTVRRPDALPPLRFAVPAPDGEYRIAAAVVPVGPMPRFFGFADWRRAGFLPEEPTEHVPLGTRSATAGRVEVELPREVGEGRHVLGVRLTPSGVAETEQAPVDPALRDRLRALGCVQ